MSGNTNGFESPDFSIAEAEPGGVSGGTIERNSQELQKELENLPISQNERNIVLDRLAETSFTEHLPLIFPQT